MNTKNITLDFTTNKSVEFVIENQPLAIMPADLAKKLLKEYATKLRRSSERDIINPLIGELTDLSNSNSSGAVTKAIEACANFIQERALIDNCANENWDVFAVQPIKTQPVRIEEMVEKSINA